MRARRAAGSVRLLPPAALARLRSVSLTYPEVGATAGPLPPGYTHTHRTRTIGRGAAQFRAAARGLLSWQMHQRVGLAPEVSDLQVGWGSVALLHLRAGPLHLSIPVEVVAVLDEPARQGFAYGTLPGHPERGEEQFVIEQQPDGTVTCTITAFSRPARWFIRLGAPLARVGQLLTIRRYLTALQELAQRPPEP